jgi:hypothetical protein
LDKLLKYQSAPTTLVLSEDEHKETVKSVIDVPVQPESSQEDDSETVESASASPMTLLRSKKRSRSESEGNTQIHKEEGDGIHQMEIRSNPVNVVQHR